ncbi:MAG TPA: HAMP domain-containing sensor histidine kinase [Gaiellaceae bacterium]|jgi:signal transduction histidine kinase|nr:HAMP domain-containing sensor histidine kinase [Gaiellaceae bacterium]
MRRAPIRIRTFLLVTVVCLLLLPTLAAGAAAWFIERDHQQAGIHHRVDTAVAYLTSHRDEMRDPATVRGFARLAARLHLLAELTLIEKPRPGKTQLYLSPALNPVFQKRQAAAREKAAPPGADQSGSVDATASLTHDRPPLIVVGSPKAHTFLAADLFYAPASRSQRALVALITGVVVLIAGLAIAIWLAGRWMVRPLGRLSAQVDKVAGGDLAIAVPDSRIREIENIAQAVDGMTVALGETAERRAEADEARRFLVTSVAHDLRTPLFALRGHLQAIGSGLGDPSVHLARAEARADALERLIGNLFAYTRDDFAQPAVQLEEIAVTELVDEITTGLEHTALLRANTFTIDGDPALRVVADRDRLRRALTNILDNALRYSPGGAAIEIGWSAADDSTVEISVRDHGSGIDADLLPHIFEPGIRGAPAAGSPDSGAGLGLAIAKRLLEHQDATLTARNEPTGGATLVLTLRAYTRAWRISSTTTAPSST